MFAPGTGLMDTFFRDNLTNKGDTTRGTGALCGHRR